MFKVSLNDVCLASIVEEIGGSDDWYTRDK